MRIYLKCLLIAVLVVTLVEAPLFASPSRVLGVITQADRAHVSSGDAMRGATVFDGDTLSTDAAGALRVRLGEAQLYLLPSSAAAVHRTAAGVSAALQRGTAVFSSLGGEAFELRASGARIRARAAQPTLAQVTLVGPYELLLTCQHGQLEVRIGEEVHTVQEATSYRVSIEPEPQGPRGAGYTSDKSDKSDKRSRCENRLYLKDGSFKVVSSYDTQGDQVRYYNLQTSAWETVPEAQVDWDATRRWERERQRACAGGAPVVTGRTRWKPIALLFIGAGTGVGIWRALISPSSP